MSWCLSWLLSVACVRYVSYCVCVSAVFGPAGVADPAALGTAGAASAGIGDLPSDLSALDHGADEHNSLLEDEGRVEQPGASNVPHSYLPAKRSKKTSKGALDAANSNTPWIGLSNAAAVADFTDEILALGVCF